MDDIVTVSILACLFFAFINGFHDGCNVIATIIASRSISPGKALWIACIAEFTGPMVMGTSVAMTVGKGIIDFKMLETFRKEGALLVFLSAVIGATAWNLVTWWLRLPSSSSHALVGGMLGTGIAAFGMTGIHWGTFLYKVVLILFTSPIIGFIAGYVSYKILVLMVRNKNPRINISIKRIQLLSVFTLGMSHGSNDAQKTMGIIAMLLLLSGKAHDYAIPLWVQLISAAMLSLGLAAGGWRLIKTVGSGIFNVQPRHSFCSQFASTVTIVAASLIGGPVSSTQIVNSSIIGVGTADRKNAVRWETVKNILISWGCTIPASAAVAALVYFLLSAVVL